MTLEDAPGAMGMVTRPYRPDDLPALVEIAQRIPRWGVPPTSHARLAELVATYFVLSPLRSGARVSTVIELDGVVCGSCLGVPDLAAQERDRAELVAPFSDLPAQLRADPPARAVAELLLLPAPEGQSAFVQNYGGIHTELDPLLQGRGAGGASGMATISLMRDAGVAELFLGGLPPGTHQRRFYERLGFTAVPDAPDGLGLSLRAERTVDAPIAP